MAIVDNLVSYWKLEESSGNARIDSHGSNDLTDNNTVGQATGKIGEGADFESGNSEYLNITNAAQTGLDFTSDFSFNSWIKPESAHIGTLCSKNGSYGNFGFTFQIRSGGELRVILSSNGTSETIKTTTAAPITTGVFQMVTAVYDASAGSVTFYYNGTSLEIETGYPTSFNNSSDDFRLGKLSSGGAAYFDGIMDETGIWNRTLTSDEITELYASGSGNQYPFLPSFTISESLSLSETSTNLRGLVSTTNESLSLSETITALKGISFTIAESLGLVESYTYLHNKLFIIAESLNVVEVKAYVQKKWSNISKSTVATVTNGVKTAVSVITNRPKS